MNNEIIFKQAECAQSSATAVEFDKFWDQVSDHSKAAKGYFAEVTSSNDSNTGFGNETQYPITEIVKQHKALINKLFDLIRNHPIDVMDNLPAIDVQLQLDFKSDELITERSQA